MSSTPQGTRTLNANSAPVASLRERVRQATRLIESEIILETLEQNRWNRLRTAQALKISYRLLMYKMKACSLRDVKPVERTAAPAKNHGDSDA